MKILMVCLGNICRSPMAEGIMRQLISEQGLDWTVDSAGTGDWHIGNPPDPRAVETARRHQVDISNLKARQFKSSDLKNFDHVFVMDKANYADVLVHAESERERERVALLLEAADPHSPEKEVGDPWFNDHLFDPVFLQLRRACEKLIEKLKDDDQNINFALWQP